MVMLRQLSERLARGRLNLERLHRFDGIRFVHTLNDSVHIAEQLLLEHFRLLRKNVLWTGRARQGVVDRT